VILAKAGFTSFSPKAGLDAGQYLEKIFIGRNSLYVLRVRDVKNEIVSGVFDNTETL